MGLPIIRLVPAYQSTQTYRAAPYNLSTSGLVSQPTTTTRCSSAPRCRTAQSFNFWTGESDKATTGFAAGPKKPSLHRSAIFCTADYCCTASCYCHSADGGTKTWTLNITCSVRVPKLPSVSSLILSSCHLNFTFTFVVWFAYHKHQHQKYHKHPLWHQRHSYLQGLRRHPQARLRGTSQAA